MSFINADTISGHPLSGSGKLVPVVKSKTQFPYAIAQPEGDQTTFNNIGAEESQDCNASVPDCFVSVT